MHPYPHRYLASAAGAPAGSVTVASPALPDIATAPPPEFDGPGGLWSPETLLCAAVANCFVLTFRSISRAARLEWSALDCHVEGTLERVDGQAQFTQFATTAKLAMTDTANAERARALLERAEHACLVSNSLRAARSLAIEVVGAAPG
jgi:organic hydroperoxide reductase OsmC/OhrA